MGRRSRPRFGSVTIRERGRLPHWEIDAGLHFVTFRLADSLPNTVLEQFRTERESIMAPAAHLGRELSANEKQRIAKLFSTTSMRVLAPVCWLDPTSQVWWLTRFVTSMVAATDCWHGA
jgi:hypothetical protein